MDEDQEYEPFHVDNDFDGGEWIEDEFYYRNKRQKRAQTKDDQIYGIFGGSSESDEEERRGRGRGEGRRTDYSKPIDFVGGTVVGQTLDDADEVAGHLNDNYRPGLGGGRGSGGLGFRSTGEVSRDDDENKDDADDNEYMPTAFGRRMRQAAEARRQRQGEHARSGKQERTGMRQGLSANPGGDIGAFEAHTKGIGSKLLAKMGWKEGQGLGKEGKGISKPLEAKMRPKGIGMGFGDRREPQMAAPSVTRGPPKTSEGGVASPTRKEAKKPRESGLWKRRNAPVRIKRTYHTADDLLEEQEAAGPTAPQPLVVVDMRGPQTRVVTKLEHLNAEALEGEDEYALPMPELQHNIRLLVELAAADIQRLDARLRQERDTKTILAREAERLAAEAASAQRSAARVSAMLQGIEAVIAGRTAGDGEGSARTAIADLRAQYPEEYVTYSIAAIALAECALPVLTNVTQGWSPLSSEVDPGIIATQFAEWRPLLTTAHGMHNDVDDIDPLAIAASPDPFTRLVSETVLPPLLRDVTTWDPQDPGPLENFINAWERVLPPAVVVYVMQHLVAPRLRAAVEAWDPLTDSIAPHTWLHPWLLAESWPTIRYKFTTALEKWHPADGSAKALLAPWRHVFGGREWEGLMGRAIVPKLEEALVEFQVNPAAQDLDAFEWVMEWADMLPPGQMTKLLLAKFFPKWHAALRHWLSDSPNVDDVTRWYLQWKMLFPDEVLALKGVRDAMNAALDAINATGSGKALPTTWTPAPVDPTTARVPPGHDVLEEAYGAVHKHATAMHAPYEDRPLRELVEEFAADGDIDFLPKLGRSREGLQIYSFGLVSCTVDSARQQILAQIGGADGREWVPASMGQMLDEHVRRSKSGSTA